MLYGRKRINIILSENQPHYFYSYSFVRLACAHEIHAAWNGADLLSLRDRRAAMQ